MLFINDVALLCFAMLYFGFAWIDRCPACSWPLLSTPVPCCILDLRLDPLNEKTHLYAVGSHRSYLTAIRTLSLKESCANTEGS